MDLFDRAVGFLPKDNSIRQTVELRNLLKKNGVDEKTVKSKVIELALQATSLTKQGIQEWRDAWETALNYEKPRRADLIEVYRDAIADLQVYGAIRNRMLKTLSRKFKVIDSETGEENVEATKALNKKWFRKFCTLALSSEYWGHSLIQFGDQIGERFTNVKIVNRAHVVPEFGIIIRELSDDDGISYRKGGLTEWVIEVGEEDNLGLLLKLAPQAIAKRHMMQYWDEFGEIFGIPIRIAKTSTRDAKENSKIDNMLQNMGSAAWGRFAQGTDIEIKESSKGDAYNVFDKRIERCNSEISKGVNGQTMTMDDGSSKSQAQVHESVSDDIVESDGTDLEYVINDDLIPFLIRKGFTAFNDNSKFIWDDTKELTLSEQMEIDKWLLEHFEIEEEYFKEKYNSRIVGYKKAATPAEPTNDPKANPEGGGGKGK